MPTVPSSSSPRIAAEGARTAQLSCTYNTQCNVLHHNIAWVQEIHSWLQNKEALPMHAT